MGPGCVDGVMRAAETAGVEKHEKERGSWRKAWDWREEAVGERVWEEAKDDAGVRAWRA